MTACAAFRALRRVPRPASALAALVCSPTPLAHQGSRPPASLGGWPGAAGSRAARRAVHARHCDALDELDGASASPGSPRRRQQERSGSPFSAADPRSASDRPLPARRPVQKKFPGVLPRQQIPAFPVTGPVAGSVPARAPQAIPGATGRDRDRHQPADSFLAAPGHRLLARPAREYRPVLAASERQNARIWAAPITAPRIRIGRQIGGSARGYQPGFAE